MRRARQHYFWIIAAAGAIACGLASRSASAQVTGKITRVGPAGGGAQLVREGAWTMVEVLLSYNGNTPFGGAIEVPLADLDGDIARFRTTVALPPGGEPRTFSVYFVAGAGLNGQPIAVRLLDERGQVVPIIDDKGATVDRLISPPVTLVPADLGLIVDLSEPAIKLLAIDPEELESRSPVNPNQERRWAVRGLDPRSLPDRWFGLEAIDVIVWDDPNPAELNPASIEAVVDWVRFGGRLVLTASRNWQVISSSRLADLLPVTLRGVRPADEVQEFTQKILSDSARDLDAHFASNPITRCVMTPLPGAIPVPADKSRLLGLEPIVYRRLIGRGTVTFIGASLRELLNPIPLPRASADPEPEPDNAEETAEQAAARKPPVDAQQAVRDAARGARTIVLERLLGVPRDRPETMGYDTLSLYSEVRGRIGFRTAGVLYLVAAFAFAVAYVVVSAGSFWFLRKRQLAQHAWTIFSAVALAASVVGAMAVWALRGVRTKLEQVTVVDAHANSPLAVGMALFGVKTPNQTRLDVRLPVAGVATEHGGEPLGPVRVMPQDARAAMLAEGTFIAPQSYTCAAASGGQWIERLPVRATLKEVEGAWEGALHGQIQGQIRTERFRTGNSTVDRFVEGTMIRNALGFDLKYCYLLETTDDTATNANLIRCFRLGTLTRDGPGAELNHESFKRFFIRDPAKDALPDAPPIFRERGELATLNSAMRDWGSSFAMWLGAVRRPSESPQASSTEDAMLLLSIFDVYHSTEGNANQAFRVTAGQGHRWGCLHQLTRDTALLVGFNETEAPPATLLMNGDESPPTRSLTMYRFVIPVVRN